jgi:hypothetical protein
MRRLEGLMGGGLGKGIGARWGKKAPAATLGLGAAETVVRHVL